MSIPAAGTPRPWRGRLSRLRFRPGRQKGAGSERSAADLVQEPVEGKNAEVVVWPDRIEYAQQSGVTAAVGRWTAAGATMGVSLLKTGVRAKRETSMIPTRMIASVTTRRAGLRFTAVIVSGGGGSIELQVSSGDAERIKAAILHAMCLAVGPPQGPPQVAPPMNDPAPSSFSPAPSSVADELVKLAQLRDARVLTPAEFHAQKVSVARTGHGHCTAPPRGFARRSCRGILPP